MRTRLNEQIKRSGYKKEHIAKEMRVSVFTISNWVAGRTQPTLSQAQKLKEILNLKSIDELVNRKEI